MNSAQDSNNLDTTLVDTLVKDLVEMIDLLKNNPKLRLKQIKHLQKALLLLTKSHSSFLNPRVVTLTITVLEEWDSYDEMNEIGLIIRPECIKLSSSGYIADKYVGSNSFTDKEYRNSFSRKIN